MGLWVPYMKISRTWGENMFIYRVRYADSHGPHEKVTTPKKRGVMKEKLIIYFFLFSFFLFVVFFSKNIKIYNINLVFPS